MLEEDDFFRIIISIIEASIRVIVLLQQCLRDFILLLSIQIFLLHLLGEHFRVEGQQIRPVIFLRVSRDFIQKRVHLLIVAGLNQRLVELILREVAQTSQDLLVRLHRMVVTQTVQQAGYELGEGQELHHKLLKEEDSDRVLLLQQVLVCCPQAS